jgi:hypothetical protein
MPTAPFLPDDQIAARLRDVAAELRRRELPTLAREVDDLAWILDPIEREAAA